MAKNPLNLNQIKKEPVFDDKNSNINFFPHFMSMKKEAQKKEYNNYDSIEYSLEKLQASNIKKKKLPTINFNGVDSIIKHRDNETKKLKKYLLTLKKQSAHDVKQCKASKEKHLARAKKKLNAEIEKLRQKKDVELQTLKVKYAARNEKLKHDYEKQVTSIKDFHDKQIEDINDNLQTRTMAMNNYII